MRIDKLFRWVGWYRLPGSNGGPLDPQSGCAIALAELIALLDKEMRTFRDLLATRQNGQKWRNTTRTGMRVPTKAPTERPKITSPTLKGAAVYGYGEDDE